MTDECSSQDIADEAAQAARQAADEATTPEARFFLREHANLLARIAAARRRAEGATAGGHERVALLAPLVVALPV